LHSFGLGSHSTTTNNGAATMNNIPAMSNRQFGTNPVAPCPCSWATRQTRRTQRLLPHNQHDKPNGLESLAARTHTV
jgi:hypothetical protein